MVGPDAYDGNIAVSLQISTDEQKTWTQWNGSVVTLNKDEKLYVKALDPNENGISNRRNIHKFVIANGKVAASGNIQYLLDPTGERMDVPAYCYLDMFRNCTSLTTAPELPATTLASNCYYEMFYGCTSLTQAPELQATTLYRSCYSAMFSGCTSLTTAPELPATTLANYCYAYMFENCTSLTEAPELPATTLDTSCYVDMFKGCTNITSVTMKNDVNPYDSSTYGTLGDNITINYV